mgnify:CR=1 FL=1
MRRKLVVGNWKMHGSKAQVSQLTTAIIAGCAELNAAVEIGICPTFLHLGLVAEIAGASAIKIGAQDAYHEVSGAYTGEVSVSMLPEFGVAFVIVGHSERRADFGDTDSLVASKFMAAQQFGMTPILCVGETLEQRQQDATEAVVLAQLDAVIDAAGIEAVGNAILAYEPIWAIGTGQTATPEQAQHVHQFIRDHLAARSKEVASVTRIIYGGSVKSDNAKELFEQADIDGGLVGGASLQAEEFISICKSADQ